MARICDISNRSQRTCGISNEKGAPRCGTPCGLIAALFSALLLYPQRRTWLQASLPLLHLPLPDPIQ